MSAVRLPPLRDPRDAQILRLAVPAFGALVAEPLFLLADAAIVGRLGTIELAGLGVAAAALGSIVALCVFLAYGTTAAVARRTGAGDLAGAVRQGVDGIWLGLALGIVLAAATLPLAPAVVRALGASREAAVPAIVYLRISAVGIPAVLLVLAATGVLRGLQDTRTPLVVAGVGAVANVGLNLLLVYPVGLGIAGSALGTVIVQVAMAGVYVGVVARGARRHGIGLRPDLPGMRASAAAGVPLVVRTVALRVALLVTTYVAARSGNVAVAAHQIAFAVWGLLALGLDALAIAGQAVTGHALGSGDTSAARGATRRMVEWGVAAGVVLGILVVTSRSAYVPLFTTDERVRTQLTAVLAVIAVQQPVAGVVFVLDGVLIGAGDARYLARVGVVTVIGYVPLALAVLALDAGLVALWWSFGAFMLARLATLVIRARGSAWLVTGAVRGP